MSKSKSKKGLRCLSIQQPFAWLVCANAKKVENRNWSTDFRGTIAIHASTKQTNVRSAARESESGLIKLEDFAFGAIIGLADIESIEFYGPEFEADGHACGPYCWKMTNGRLLKEPIPMMGKLSLYHLDPEIEAKVLASETYSVDLTQGTKHAIIAREFEPEPEPYFTYQYCIDELEEKVDLSVLYQFANRRVELEPDRLASYELRAKFAKQLGNVEQASHDVKRMCQIVNDAYGNGENDETLKAAADTYVNSIREPIEESFSEEANEEPEAPPQSEYERFVSLLEFLSQSLADLGHIDEAIEMNARLLKLEPSSHAFLYDRGFFRALGEKGSGDAIDDFKKAYASLERKIANIDEDIETLSELESWRPLILVEMARVHRVRSEYDLAMSAIQTALEKHPADPSANLEAALIAEEKKDFEKAVQFANRTIELGSFVVEAEELLQRIEQNTKDSKSES